MKRTLSALAALALTAGAALPASSAMDSHMMMAPGKTVTIMLAPQNASGESGKAMLKDMKMGLQVVLMLSGGMSKGPQPAHIHLGTCAKLDPKPEYPLKSVINGTSTTMLPGITIAKLMATPNAINVHKSATDIPTYVSCGNISMMKPAM